MPTTHIVRSFNAAGSLICTPHGSLAEAQKEQRHRITEAHHRYVMILTVEAFPIEMDRCNIVAWREVIPAKRPAAMRREQVAR